MCLILYVLSYVYEYGMCMCTVPNCMCYKYGTVLATRMCYTYVYCKDYKCTVALCVCM